VINLNETDEMQKEQDQVSRSEELFNKYLAGELTNEEKNELLQKSIVSSLESMETVRELREEIGHHEEEVSFLGTAATVYQDFIISKGLNEEFFNFFEEILSEASQDEQEPAPENESITPSENVH
jgi:precorrin isomerase